MMEINTASARLFAMQEIKKTFLLGTVALKQPANICLVYHLLQIQLGFLVFSNWLRVWSFFGGCKLKMKLKKEQELVEAQL